MNGFDSRPYWIHKHAGAENGSCVIVMPWKLKAFTNPYPEIGISIGDHP